MVGCLGWWRGGWDRLAGVSIGFINLGSRLGSGGCEGFVKYSRLLLCMHVMDGWLIDGWGWMGLRVGTSVCVRIR